MPTLPQSFVSPEEYREREQRAEGKSEYFQGEMFTIAGASPAHMLIAASLLANLYPQLRQTVGQW